MDAAQQGYSDIGTHDRNSKKNAFQNTYPCSWWKYHTLLIGYGALVEMGASTLTQHDEAWTRYLGLCGIKIGSHDRDPRRCISGVFVKTITRSDPTLQLADTWDTNTYRDL